MKKRYTQEELNKALLLVEEVHPRQTGPVEHLERLHGEAPHRCGGRLRERRRDELGLLVQSVEDRGRSIPRRSLVVTQKVEEPTRLGGVASALFAAILDCFRRSGVSKVRTLTGRDNSLVLSFFRSQGMMAAPFIPLELDLE